MQAQDPLNVVSNVVLSNLVSSDFLSTERAGYFRVPGAHLYTVLHEVSDPIARVLLSGPFASERHNSYIPWVRWARYLAERRIEVLRYDYRGVGESTGQFEQMTFEDWTEDIQLLFAWLKGRTPEVPVLMHGLELGALLAARAFDSGLGDGLLLWSPPAQANAVLRSTLLRWVGLEQLFKTAEERVAASHYIRQLEAGSAIEVEGFPWSAELWKRSFEFALPAAMSDEEQAKVAYGRPVRIVTLTKQAAPLVKGGSVGYDEAKDFSWLFAPNFDWMAATAAGVREWQ